MAIPAQAIAQRVRGYATGGLVSPLAGMAARASGLLKQASGGDLGALISESLATAMRLPTPAYAGESVAPSRTIRVELAVGNRKVEATLDARDEARLLDLLKDAQARAL